MRPLGQVRRVALDARRVVLTATTLLVLAAAPLRRAVAGDPLDHYGGLAQLEGLAKAQVLRYASPPVSYAGLRGERVVLTMVQPRLRAIAALGAESNHGDGADSADGGGGIPGDVAMDGTAYGVLDLPLQSTGISVYAIVGLVPLKRVLAALVSTPAMSVCGRCDLQPLPPHHIDTAFAGGAGSQFNFGSWTLRFECQCFIGAGGHAGFVSVGLTRTFR